jgi:stage III sporulation protein AD
MSDWLKVIAYVLITLFLGALLKELGFKGSKLVLLLGVVSVLGAAVIYIGEMLSFLPKLNESVKEYAVAMLKILGVGYAFGICSDICAELGETTLAGAVCLFGRIEIVMLSVPFIKTIVEKGIELI